MGIFDGIDAADVEVLNFNVKRETLFGTITSAEVRVKEETGSKGILIEWSFEGREYGVKEYYGIPTTPPAAWDKETVLRKKDGGDMPEQYNTEFKANMAKYGDLKKRYISLGIPEERFNSVEVEDLEGLTGNVTIGPQKDNPSFARVISVAQPGAAGTRLPKPAVKATAKAAAPVVEDDDDLDFEGDD